MERKNGINLKTNIQVMAGKIRLIIILVFSASAVFGQTPKLVKAVARPGDGVYSLLRLYQLEKDKCNIERFYKINGLGKKDYLKANNVYYLPLYSYPYNGKSIRSTIKDSNMPRARRIQSFNEKMLASKLRAKGYQETKVLWVPHHELGCKDIPTKDDPIVNKPPEQTPPKEIEKPKEPPKEVKEEVKPEKPASVQDDVKNRNYPIFGKRYAEVPLVDNKLKNKVYYIVSGHGGPDPGAVGESKGKNLCEDEYAYDVSLRLARNLLKRGAIVYIITRDPNDGIRSGSILECDKDELCWENQVIPLNVKKRLAQRSNAVNKLYEYHKSKGITKQTAIMIHVDSRSVKERVDLFFYHFPGSNQGERLASTLYSVMARQYKANRPSGKYEGTVTGRDLFMLRETKPTAVYVEMGNIQNRNDQARFTVEENRQALANWLAMGLLKAAQK